MDQQAGFFSSDEILNILALSNNATAIYTTEDLIIQIANDAMTSLWGKDRNVIGKPLILAVPELEGQPFIDILKNVWCSGVTYEAKEVPAQLFINGQLKTCYFNFIYKAVKNETGEIKCILHTATDVTEQRRSRLALEEQRDRMQRFFMQAPAGICILDGPDFVFELANPAYQQQLFPNRELTGKALLDALPELEGQPILDVLKEVYRTGNAFEGNELLIPLPRASDGVMEDKYFNFIYQARRSDNGEIDGILAFVIDVTEPVINRKKIEESEATLRSMIMTAHYGLMILKGRDWKIEIVNQQIATLWQKSLAEITGRKLMDVLPELEGQPFPALLTNVYDTGIGYSQEEEALYIDSPDGPLQRYVSFYYDPLLDADGNVGGIIVACEDITEKVKARKLLEDSYIEQQALNEELTAVNDEVASTNDELIDAKSNLEKLLGDFRESENRLQSIVESAPFPIGVYKGREMRIVLANKAIMDVFGKGYDVVGKLYSEVLPELDNQAIFSQLDQVYTTGIPFHARNQRVDIVVDGRLQPYYFNYSFTPLFDTAGNIYGVMNTAAEVTDIVLAKQMVEKSEQNLHNMILQAPVAICILMGPKHVITVANELMIDLWGKPVDTVMYKPVFEALPDAREQGLEELMFNVYDKGETFHAPEMPVSLVRNGVAEVVYQNFVYQPYRDTDGTVLGVIAITIDITEQVMARKKIEQSEAELLDTKVRLEQELEAGRQIQRQKDGFIGMASHELKTPLTTLTAIIQVANAKLKNHADPFLAGALDKANSQVKRMTAMINGFLNISRLESGKIHVEKHTFRIDTLIQEMVDEIALIAPGYDIHFTGKQALEVNADRDKIGSVISNFLSNAVKYSPKASSIEIKCSRTDGRLIISVKDAGMGIKPQDMEKIFDRYYRVEASHTRHISGFGIGLYLSAEIIQRHNGEIWVESEPGNGSTFYFSIPIN